MRICVLAAEPTMYPTSRLVHVRSWPQRYKLNVCTPAFILLDMTFRSAEYFELQRVTSCVSRVVDVYCILRRCVQSRPSLREARGLAVCLLLFSVCHSTLSIAQDDDCGELENAYGPFDFRTIPAVNLYLVEKAHFTPQVAQLVKGESAALGADLDYTLRAIPNHPRAIVAMANLSFKERKDPPRGARYTVKCWFDRAMRIAPDDPKVRSAYGYFLSRKGESKNAVEQLQLALDLGLDDGNTHYNLGLVFFTLKEYDKAAEQAKIAEARGFPLQGLRNKLKAIGKWAD